MLLVVWVLFAGLPASAQLYINEFSASNTNTIADPDYDDYSDWLEIYNGDTQSWNLNGFYITDNFDLPEKWRINVDAIIPPGEFIVIWADDMAEGLHANFRISAGGEQLAILTPGGRLLDSISFSAQAPDISFGRIVDGTGPWAYFTEPTPGASNSTPHYSGLVHHIPDFSLRGGIYADLQNIEIHSSFGGEIRYTTDGSEPEIQDQLYTIPVQVTKTTILRARIFMEDMVPGPVITQSYFINENAVNAALPVVSIATNPDNFWDPEQGIYVQDFKPDWEIPVNIELFENNGLDRAAFNERAGIKINGLYSWQLPQKMLGVYFRNSYGAGKLNYKIVPQRQRHVYDNFALRASGSDWSYTLFRDVLGQHSTMGNMDLDIMGFKQAVVYVNGEYLGIHNIREKVDEDYIISNFNLEEGSVDMVENEDYAEAGDLLAYQDLQALLNKDLSNASNYAAVEEVVDIENFTDYVITEMATRNTSISHNVMAWKPKEGGKWRWILMDLDRGFFDAGSNFIGFYLDQDPLILADLFENQGYREYFAKRLNAHLLTTFNPEHMKDLIDEHASAIAQEVPRHINRWQGTTSSYGDAIPSLQYWQDQVCYLRNFVDERPAALLVDLHNHGFERTSHITLQVYPEEAGKILVEGLQMPVSSGSGPVVNGMDLQIECISNPGYTFLNWKELIPEPVIPEGAVYKYLDLGTPPATDWTAPAFDDSNWKEGQAQLGYGDDDENTVIDYGGDPNNKRITYYFRKNFQVNEEQLTAGSFQIQILKDDGAIIYLNGSEVLRSNMPCGPVDQDTQAETGIVGEAEDLFTTYSIPSSALKKGENVLAVEVHQRSETSSDLSFDLRMNCYMPGTGQILSIEKAFTLNVNEDHYYIANFERDNSCLIPSVLTEDLILTTDCSPYLVNEDVLVPEGVTLTIDPGVEVLMPEGGNIFIYGILKVNGTGDAPVHIQLHPDHQGSWGGMVFNNTPDTSVMKHLILTGASGGPDPVTENAAISAFNADLRMENLSILDVESNPIMARYSNVSLRESKLHSKVTGDLINVKYGEAEVIHCEFTGNDQPDTDGIDYDDVVDGVIRNCTFHNFLGFNSDAIDIGEESSRIRIDSVFAMNITDKGVSLGQWSSAMVRNSVFINCNLGVVAKDSSSAVVENCIFYSTGNAISCYEKNIGLSGGNAYVKNSILSNGTGAPLYADSRSRIEISYSLSDDGELLPGEANVLANPLFRAPAFFDFELQPGSPAIQSGIGSKGAVDMGTDLPVTDQEPPVCISGFFIDPLSSVFPEFIVLYNPSSVPVDLSGYEITKGVTAVIPDGVTIAPHGKVYITDQSSNYLWDQVDLPVIEWLEGKLSNNGEALQLEDRYGIVMDHIVYDELGGWPVDGFSGDQMFVLDDVSMDNHFPEYWSTESLYTVSSGKAEYSDVMFNVWPNPTRDFIYINAPGKHSVSFSIYNQSGILLYKGLLNETGSTPVDMSKYGDGIYLVRSGPHAAKVIVMHN